MRARYGIPSGAPFTAVSVDFPSSVVQLEHAADGTFMLLGSNLRNNDQKHEHEAHSAYVHSTSFTARITDTDYRNGRYARVGSGGGVSKRTTVFEAVSQILTRTFPWLSMSPPWLDPFNEAFMCSDIFSWSPSGLQAPAKQMLACETPRVSPTTAAHRRYLHA